MTFTMVSIREPRSINAERKEQYKAELRREAAGWMRRKAMLKGVLYMRIVWFNNEKWIGDVDNITKPIRDALQGVVYDNDNIIVKSITERINYISETYELIADDLSKGDAYKMLDEFLLQGRYKHIIYIEVGTMSIQPTRRITIGPLTRE